TPPTATTGGPAEEKPQELGAGGEPGTEPAEGARKTEGPEEVTSLRDPTAVSDAGKIPALFYGWFWGLAGAAALLLFAYYWRMAGEQLESLKELSASVVPLGVLTVVVLAVILFGISTATESAAIAALGAMYLAARARFQRPVWWWSLAGAIMFLLGWPLESTVIIVI